MENRGKKVDESGSEISESEGEEAAEEEGEGILKSDGKKKEKTAEHAPVKKTNEAIKKSQFLGEKYGHYKCGVYIRIEVRLDKAISRKLEPEYPVVLCSLKHQETSMCYVRVKIKKHRWYPHVLKPKDPVTFSIGWRKF